MAKVYISSTVADLEAERRAVMEWLVTARHQPVHSYRPDNETVRESCLDDINVCDLYVLILGYRYGFQPEEGNPEKLSITHLEFRRAGQLGIPRIALLSTSIQNIRLSDVLDVPRAALVLAFNEEVRREVRPAEFSDLQGLIQALSTGVQNELDKLRRKNENHPINERAAEPEIIALLLRAADHISRLIEKPEERTRALFLDHIDPLYQDLRRIMDDYRQILDWALTQLKDVSVPVGELSAKLRQKREQNLRLREEMRKYTTRLLSKFADDQIEKFCISALKLLVMNPTTQGEDISLDFRGGIQDSPVYVLVREYEDRSPAQYTDVREDHRELLKCVTEDYQRRLNNRWEMLSEIYYELRTELLV